MSELTYQGIPITANEVMENIAEHRAKAKHYCLAKYVYCVRTSRHWRGRKFVFTALRPHFKMLAL